MRYAALVLFVWYCGLTACGRIPLPGEKAQDPEVRIAVSGAGGESELKEFYLSDHTHCAALIGVQKAALSCNWGDK